MAVKWCSFALGGDDKGSALRKHVLPGSFRLLVSSMRASLDASVLFV
jgi:hypothetical protein